MRNCRNDEIINPLSNECVVITSRLGKSLIKKHSMGKIQLSEIDLQKIKSLNLPRRVSKKNRKIIIPDNDYIMGESNTYIPIEIPEDIKIKINKFIEDSRKEDIDIKIIDNGYKKYCNTFNLGDLKKPIVNISMNIDFPIMKMESSVGFNLDALNFATQDFILTRIKGIFFNFNNYSLKNLLHKGVNDSVAYFEDLIDYNWLFAMNDYIYNLSTEDLYTIIGYTHYGDVIVNNYMRNKLNENKFMKDLTQINKWFVTYYPFFFQAISYIEENDVNMFLKEENNTTKIYIPSSIAEHSIDNKFFKEKSMYVIDILQFIHNGELLKCSTKYILLYLIAPYLDFTLFWKKVIQRYIFDLNYIIKMTPVLTQPLVVYRGVKDDYYLKGNAGFIYKTDSFISTSVNLTSALNFAGPKCCFKRITLLPNTHALLLVGISKYSNEIELLLGSESMFYITKAKKLIPKITTDICKDNYNEIIVSDLVIIK